MSPRLPTLIVTLAVAATACSSGDDAAPETVATTEPPRSTIEVEPGTCEDVPDPASFPVDVVPPPIPPCTAPDELVVHTIRAGGGRAAADGDRIVIDYVGMRSVDGVVFDNSYDRGVPYTFPLGRGGVIQGWDEGLVGAQAGATMRLDIPTAQAYGDQPPASDVIRAGDDLSFVVEVRAIIAATTAEDAPLDVTLTPSVGALEVTVDELRAGDGPTVAQGDTAIVHVLLVRGDNQVVLFNSWGRDDPLQVVMDEGGSLPGIIDGIEGASVGSLRVITMPPDAGFGVNGNPSLGLPGGVDLVVVAEVVGIF